jgi:hypothetical protein
LPSAPAQPRYTADLKLLNMAGNSCWASSMSAPGHEDAFPRPRLSARCRFSQGTFAGTRGNGRDAPIPAVRRVESNRQGRTHIGHSPFADLRLGVSFTEYGIECLRQTIADERAAGHAPSQVKPPK